MKNKEIKNNELQGFLNGLKPMMKQGSMKFRYAVYKNMERASRVMESNDRYLEGQKSEALKQLETDRNHFLKMTKPTNTETALKTWEKYGELVAEAEKYIESVRVPFGDLITELDIYEYTLKPEDLECPEPVTADSFVGFKTLEIFTKGLEKLMK